ncbi:uncharacterized protein VTP21DRAFT_4916 [Calcarisporiella thermophila]|uniref:uncharacterized protein n=1 Tax=Calcarisporiella thermophila TaxID=911321 RepID=UPI0037423A40
MSSPWALQRHCEAAPNERSCVKPVIQEDPQWAGKRPKPRAAQRSRREAAEGVESIGNCGRGKQSSTIKADASQQTSFLKNKFGRGRVLEPSQPEMRHKY